MHSGRGGTINFKFEGKQDCFTIEMGAEGHFSVFTGRSKKYVDIRMELRAFLNSTDREGWVIEE
ncbi:hypothetical protein CBF23_005075 [Marinomonas agarivorans]|nr:hypothetical protein CBF23_005075 [Marinomonas agarivorans]